MRARSLRSLSGVLLCLGVSSFVGVGGVGCSGAAGGAGPRAGTRAAPCFASLLSPLSKRQGTHDAQRSTRPGGAGLVLRKPNQGVKMVFLPPDWDGSPTKEADGDGREGKKEPGKRSRSPMRNPLDLDPLEEERTEVIRSYSPISGFDLGTPDEVIEELRPTGLEKHRLKLHPDEAFGSVFRYEGALVDTLPIHKEAWNAVAKDMNLTVPDDDDVIRAMSMPTEKAIQRVMYWTQDWGDTKRLAFAKAEAFYKCWQNYNHTVPQSAVSWLEKLSDAKIPMCLVTSMDLQSINASVTRMGIDKYFDAFVTAEDDADTRSQMYLSAAIKLQRPPNFCVYFDSDPEGIAAAHDISARAVSVLGIHKAWELSTSDLTVASLDELTTYNMRRLFAEVGEGRIEDQLEMEVETQTQKSRWSSGPWGRGYEDPDDPYVYSSRGR